MGYSYYVVNHTKKQVVGCGVKMNTWDGQPHMEDMDTVVKYLIDCRGDMVQFVGEDKYLIEQVVYETEPNDSGYIHVKFEEDL